MSSERHHRSRLLGDRGGGSVGSHHRCRLRRRPGAVPTRPVGPPIRSCSDWPTPRATRRPGSSGTRRCSTSSTRSRISPTAPCASRLLRGGVINCCRALSSRSSATSPPARSIWAGSARACSTPIGDTDFQALTAPMLIDSYPLQQAVLDSDIPAQMLAGLDELGVHGIAVLADGLRKPIAAARPLLRPADYEGITFQAFRSLEHAAAIRALGATPTDVRRRRWCASRRHDRRVREGPAHLRRQRLQLSRPVRDRQRQPVAPHPGADRQPRHAGRPDRDATELADERRVRRRVALHRSHRRRPRRCSCGCARKAPASPTPPPPTWTAMRQAFAPEYATMNRDPTTKIFIERIEALKETTDPGPGLDIPADCTGPAAVTPTRGSIAPTTMPTVGWRRRWMARTGGRSPRLMRWRMGCPTTRRRRVRRRSRGSSR